MSHHEIPANARQSLAARLRGTATAPGDTEYDADRAAWNLAVDQHPAVVVRAADDTDVAVAVRFAAEHGLGVAVQATGHGVARPADDALLLLTAAMDGVQVDTAARTARIEAGAQWGTVLEKAAPDGLAPLLGSSPGVGAVGYTLGGGLGWLARRYGLAADSVRSFEVVTADGHRVRASAQENQELFWGLHGGGAGSLGVVTAMEVGLFPANQVYGGNLLYPADLAREVATRYAEWIARAPDELTSSLVLMNFPPFDMVPEPLRGRSFAIIRGCHSGSIGRCRGAAALLARLAAARDRPVRPDALQRGGDHQQRPGGPHPRRHHHRVAAGPRPGSHRHHRGPHLHRRWPAAGDDDRGAPHRRRGVARRVRRGLRQPGRHAAAGGGGGHPHPGGDGRPCTPIFARLHERLRPHTTGGAYLNFLEGAEKVARTREGFTAEDYRRLQALKHQYDPQDLFRYGIDLVGS